MHTPLTKDAARFKRSCLKADNRIDTLKNSKRDIGRKRQCTSCERPSYDLGNENLPCPICGGNNFIVQKTSSDVMLWERIAAKHIVAMKRDGKLK